MRRSRRGAHGERCDAGGLDERLSSLVYDVVTTSGSGSSRSKRERERQDGEAVGRGQAGAVSKRT